MPHAYNTHPPNAPLVDRDHSALLIRLKCWGPHNAVELHKCALYQRLQVKLHCCTARADSA